MNARTTVLSPTRVLVIAAAATVLLLTACGGDKSATGDAAAPSASSAAPAAAAAPAGFGNGDAPDTSGMGQIIIEKINAQPAVEGKATLVEFGQKSIESDPIGDSVVSAVVEFEGIVTFSSDVQWSWQGPTKAGEPQKFEARAEYINQGKGWELVPPMGIYPL
jgi:hypothetical protein